MRRQTSRASAVCQWRYCVLENAKTSSIVVLIRETSMDHALLLDIFLIVCTLALIVAFVLHQIRTLSWLKRHGRRIVATVISIRHETGKARAGSVHEHYYVTARWTNPLTGRTYTFWTWIMDSCPGYTQGSLVSILVDPSNPKRYIMEL